MQNDVHATDLLQVRQNQKPWNLGCDVGNFRYLLKNIFKVALVREFLPLSGDPCRASFVELHDLFGVFFQLYGDFADEFELSECKLAIVHCAGHYDPILIETLWRDIIEAGMYQLLCSDPRLTQTGKPEQRSGESARLPLMWPGFDSSLLSYLG